MTRNLGNVKDYLAVFLLAHITCSGNSDRITKRKKEM